MARVARVLNESSRGSTRAGGHGRHGPTKPPNSETRRSELAQFRYNHCIQPSQCLGLSDTDNPEVCP